MNNFVKLSTLAVIVTTSVGVSANTLDVGFSGSVGPSPCDITANADIIVPDIPFDTLDVNAYTVVPNQKVVIDIICDNSNAPLLVFFTHAQDIALDSNNEYVPAFLNLNLYRKSLPILGIDGTFKGDVVFSTNPLSSLNYVDSQDTSLAFGSTSIEFNSSDKVYIKPYGNSFDVTDAMLVTALPYNQAFDILYAIDKELIDASKSTPLTASFNAMITYL